MSKVITETVKATFVRNLSNLHSIWSTENGTFTVTPKGKTFRCKGVEGKIIDHKVISKSAKVVWEFTIVYTHFDTFEISNIDEAISHFICESEVPAVLVTDVVEMLAKTKEVLTQKLYKFFVVVGEKVYYKVYKSESSEYVCSTLVYDENIAVESYFYKSGELYSTNSFIGGVARYGNERLQDAILRDIRDNGGNDIVTGEEYEEAHNRAIKERYPLNVISEEITEERYYEMLEVLPPQNWEGGRFTMAERQFGSITQMFLQVDNRFFCGWVDLEDKRTFLNRQNVQAFDKAQRVSEEEMGKR